MSGAATTPPPSDYGFLGDFLAIDVLMTGFLACGADQAEAEYEMRRFLGAVEEALTVLKRADDALTVRRATRP